jgi:hypothetical protein
MLMIDLCPDFISHRVESDLWPSLKKVLEKEQRCLSQVKIGLYPYDVTEACFCLFVCRIVIGEAQSIAAHSCANVFALCIVNYRFNFSLC